MSSDIFIQSLRLSFEEALNAAVDARLKNSIEEVRSIISALKHEADLLKERVVYLEAHDQAKGISESRVKELIESEVADALDGHTSEYDHDRYDRACEAFDGSGFDSLEDAIRNVCNHASISIDF